MVYHSAEMCPVKVDDEGGYICQDFWSLVKTSIQVDKQYLNKHTFRMSEFMVKKKNTTKGQTMQWDSQSVRHLFQQSQWKVFSGPSPGS